MVGAGFAGLTAARTLRRSGKSVVVLEARDRVGGRVWTQQLADGTPVDRGGAWLAPGRDEAFTLAGELGVSTYRTWSEGFHLLIEEERIHRYRGLIPKISPPTVISIALAQLRIDLTAKRVPLEAPWSARRAGAWDAQTVASWLERSGIRTTIGQNLFEMALQGLFATDLAEVSLLDLLFLVRAHGSTTTLFSVEGGSQENLIEGGAGTIARRMADDLGDGLVLDAPVRSITEQAGGIVVRSDGVAVQAADVVVAVPPALALKIFFEPDLSPERRRLYEQAVAGKETKTVVIYDEPFWRAEGLSGQSAGPGSPAEVTIDASPSHGGHGALASFTFGPVAQRLEALDPDERRSALLRELVGRFGPKAKSPLELVETAWWNEPWTLGCSMAHFPPGVLTRSGPLLREPFGRVHWAGTETATTSHGAIDGAIRSGLRAAAAILGDDAPTPPAGAPEKRTPS